MRRTQTVTPSPYPDAKSAATSPPVPPAQPDPNENSFMRRLYSVKSKKIGPQTSWIKTVLKSDKQRVRRVASNDPDLDTNAPRDKLLFLEKMRSSGKESEEDVSPQPTGYTANRALNASVDGS